MDKLQERLATYACALNYEDLSPEAIHAAKVRVIDTLGALVGGFSGESCQIARAIAGLSSSPMAATILGTREKSSPEMAAFANAATARYMESNDVYHWPGSGGGHPSDTLTPVLAVAEPVHAGGREFINAIILAYEVYLRVGDATKTSGWDAATRAVLAVAIGAGKLLGLSREQITQCISLAVVPNNALGQTRSGNLSMWKSVAAGQAGKAGVFAALLARQGMEGPNLPFEGAAGWFRKVSGEAFSLESMGGNGTPFKILDTMIKPRASCGSTISSILAAERAHVLLNGTKDVERVTVEVYEPAKRGMGTGEENWHPETRETADHSIPYVVAAALMDGTVGPSQFTMERIHDPELMALLQKVEVVSNPEFTKAYESVPVGHFTRVEVVTRSGERHVGEVNSIKGDTRDPMTDGEIEDKFRNNTRDVFDDERVGTILARLWQLEEMEDVAEIPPAFVL